jgi:hypothetical protein
MSLAAATKVLAVGKTVGSKGPRHHRTREESDWPPICSTSVRMKLHRRLVDAINHYARHPFAGPFTFDQHPDLFGPNSQSQSSGALGLRDRPLTNEVATIAGVTKPSV